MAKDFDDKNVFALIGRFDEAGSLRVDDNGFEQSQENNDDNKLYMTKLWGFINNQKTEPVKCEDYICKFKRGDYDTLCASNKAKDKFNCQYCYGNSYGNFCDVYDENGKRIVAKSDCDNNYLNCDRETIYWEDGTKRSESNACNSGVYESCLIISLFNEEGQITSKKVYKPSTEGYISGQCQINGSYAPINPECANKIYCNGTVCHVYDNNGSHRIKLYNCSDN